MKKNNQKVTVYFPENQKVVYPSKEVFDITTDADGYAYGKIYLTSTVIIVGSFSINNPEWFGWF